MYPQCKTDDSGLCISPENHTEKKDVLTLKWGTLKKWSFHSKKAEELLEEYFKIGSVTSAIMQEDTDRQKQIICELIEEGNFDYVFNDWTGEKMTKEKAKQYVMDY